MNEEQKPDFFGLGIAPKLLEMLDKHDFKTPTPIQVKSIPIAIEGKDLVGIAQTGTGKTLAFGIPMMQNIARMKGSGLVLVPTRELAAQVNDEIMRFGRPLGLRTAVIIGGASMQPQVRALQNNPHMIIATPGRMNDHLSRKGSLLDRTKVLVLDEADRMLDMGFEPQIRTILNKLPKERQTMLFSATMPSGIMDIARTYMQLPLRVEIAPPGTTVKEVEQEVIFLTKNDKFPMLSRLLDRFRGSILVFSRTKWGAKKLADAIRKMGHTATEIHSNRSLFQRKAAITGFKKGTYRVLVATDIAARGIDMKGIELVLNYDLPGTPDDYVHRVGRTARAGIKGKAITFAIPDEAGEVRAIERLIRMTLPVGKDSSAQPQMRSHSSQRSKPRGGFRSRQNRSNFRNRERGNPYRGRR